MNKTEYKGKLYFAPMEGITTRVYRSVFRKHFTGIDRFYTPFLAATQTHHFKKRELKEIEPFEGELVPQILTANSDDFVWAAKMIRQMGYPEVDLNLGCPYPTVFTKGKGSGMLKDMERLDRFFSEVFSIESTSGASSANCVKYLAPSMIPRIVGTPVQKNSRYASPTFHSPI